jgi:SAM-dependent methyltransferase
MGNVEYEYYGFIDPITKETLLFDSYSQKAMAGDGYFQIENGVIDFYNRLKLENAPKSLGSNPAISTLQVSQAPELQDAHDKAFRDSESTGGNIYGEFNNLPKIAQSGHYRRMEILDNLEIGNIENKVAVDFGTGPWGYASIFPRLRAAQKCIGFDVSKVALLFARKATPHEIDRKTVYATADGDFIPLADDSVDIFFGGEVIEHVRNPFLFLQEIARVCKDSAIVILTTPNRDAFNWKIFRQQYCVGPEHIALMNYEEFKKTLECFCKEIKIFGYESSLSRSMDNEPIDADTLAKLQARAESYPELSTGMISTSKVEKGLYVRNRRALTLKECLWNSTSITYSPQEGSPLTLFGDIKGLLMTNAMEAKLSTTGKDISLLFWGHDWSGIVEICCGNVEICVDLYSEAGGFIRVDIDNEDLAKEMVLRHTGRKNSKAHSDEVIFYKIIEYTHEVIVSSVSPSCVVRLATKDAIREFVEKANALQSESHSKWHSYVCSHKFICDLQAPADENSYEYRDFQLNLWKLISGRDTYSPYINEKNDNLKHVASIRDAYPFVSKSPVEIGNYFIAVASILKKIALPPPARILEYGVGWGHTSRFLSNCGFDVTSLDIEQSFLDLIPKFSQAGANDINLVCSSFVDAKFKEKIFDAVIFFECFHHCVEHNTLVSQLRKILKPGGKIIFCAESFYDDWFDYPWGVRLDGHSVWAIRNFGWMELGFKKEYIDRLLCLNGFSAEWTTVEDIGAYGVFCVATLKS